MAPAITFLDFFSGIGGFRKRFELCGMTCRGHCEIDKYADRSYRAIFDIKEDEWYQNDITKVSATDLPRVNLWSAGFPCQDISVSGCQRGLAGERSGLFFELIRLLKGKNPEDRPEWLVLENVKNLLFINQGWDFTLVLSSLAVLGYHIEYGLLNSKFHGVPQNRERVYLVAYRHFRTCDGRKIFPVQCGDSKTLIRLIDGKQGQRVYDSHGISCTLTSEGGGFGGKTGLYFIDLCNGNPKLTDTARCIMARYDGCATNRSCESSGVFIRNCTVSDCSDCPQKIKVNNGTKQGYAEAGCGDGVVLSFPESKTRRGRVGHGTAQTLDTSCNQGTVFAGCGRIRRLTPRECWRLQGFSDEMFDKAAAVNSDSQLYRQAGNSVTIPVVYTVGKRIAAIQNELDAEREGDIL